MKKELNERGERSRNYWQTVELTLDQKETIVNLRYGEDRNYQR